MKNTGIIKTVIILVGLVMLFMSCETDNKNTVQEHIKRKTEVRELLKMELGDKYDLPIPPTDTLMLSHGREIYLRICATCHGEEGKGDGRFGRDLLITPSDFTDLEQASFYSDQARLHIIRKGIESTPMLGWENVLTEDDITAVHSVVRSFTASNPRD